MTSYTPQINSPFHPKNHCGYARWRDAKLASYPCSITPLRVPIYDPFRLTPSECWQLSTACKHANLAIFSTLRPEKDKRALQALARTMGLTRADTHLCADGNAISSIEVSPQGNRAGYIPYTNRPLSWHTDGYYNPLHLPIRAMVLYCVQEAATGGDNLFVDHELIYLQLRDQNPDFIKALMDPDAMTIPANRELRPAQSGPVFSLNGVTGHLHMRYTARTQSVVWKADPVLEAAREYLKTLLTQKNPYLFRYRLRPGEGILCNNVLHGRLGFKDAPPNRHRLVYRIRYHDRIGGTKGLGRERFT